MSIERKLDYDRHDNYRIEIVASDLGECALATIIYENFANDLNAVSCARAFVSAGIPSLSATTTLSVNIINSNDKDPYFTPQTQRAEVREDAQIGTRIHQLMAHDPDVTSQDALIYETIEPITAVSKNGKEVTDNNAFKKLFLVDKYGNVTVNGSLDRDYYAVVRLTVTVTDTTAPTLQLGQGVLVVTIIEVNELPPVSK